jgi:2-polyprenyl-6-methoxyphenol hydroxylase-like FAD-dependent oxidoreductase
MDSVRNAVVLGASLGGLVTAKVLSEVYDTVTVVDRDELPELPGARRGVPQSRQLHVVLARGRQDLDALFDGLSDELGALGAPQVDLNYHVHWHNDGYRMRRSHSGLIGIGISRTLLEHVVRERVRHLSNVRFHGGAAASELCTTDDRSRVVGVQVTPRDGAPYAIDADLVVDACGRSSRTPAWLTALGYPAPPEQRVKIDITYATRIYRREPHHLGGRLGALTNAVPDRPRTGVVAAQENDTFAVAVCGVLGDEPPLDPDGYTRFAESLGVPEITALVHDATPLGPPVRMRFPASVRRRYERLRRLPAGLLVVGDALCSFNPVYGQGITVAAAEAVLLRRLLRTDRADLSRRFFSEAAGIIDRPWAIAVGTDLRFPAVQGRRTPKIRFVNAYVHRLHAAARHDPVLGAAFLRVLNLIDPPARLLRPAIAIRVVRGGWRAV